MKSAAGCGECIKCIAVAHQPHYKKRPQPGSVDMGAE